MIVGVPKEIKDRENRVSVTPAGVAEYVARGHHVLVERTAGDGSSFSDAEFETAGAELVGSHSGVFARAESRSRRNTTSSARTNSFSPTST